MCSGASIDSRHKIFWNFLCTTYSWGGFGIGSSMATEVRPITIDYGASTM